MRTIKKIEARSHCLPDRKKVAAYARVSKESERLHHSLSSQVSYYNEFIQKNPSWEFAGVYADEGISGTSSDQRLEFQRMLADCEAGKVDIILTKSISRFARNTVDLLETVRHLRDLGIEVQFEKEHIHSLSGDGELLLSILASFAQAESESISENIKWSKKKQAEQGIMTNTAAPYGYRCVDRQLVIIPEQAEVVKMIFEDYTENGLTAYDIADKLNDAGIPGQRGNHWQMCTIRRMLFNEAYKGDLLLLKYYRPNPLVHKSVKNQGEQPMYLVENAHEAIISWEVFQKAQERLKQDGELGRYANKNVSWNEFTEKIICKGCGRYFGKATTGLKTGRVVSWSCKKPGGKCMTPTLLESELQEIFCKVTGEEEYAPEKFKEMIDHLEVGLDDVITFFFRNGHQQSCQFKRRRGSPLKARREDTTALAGKIRCSRCGGAFGYRSQQSASDAGNRLAYWRCKKCGGFSLRDDDLKRLIAKVMGTTQFEEEAFREKISGIEIFPDRELQFTFFDGRQDNRKWDPPTHKGVPWSDERRKDMSETMKQIRREKKWPQ